MIRCWALKALGLALMALPTMAAAAESGLLIRKDNLRGQPFIDAPVVVWLEANEPLSILDRQGGWMQVDARGKSGWVRMLNVRLPSSASGGGQSSLLAASAMYRTGSSGSTVTTGVKGLGESDLRTAQPDFNQLAALEAQGVSPADATAQAADNKLAPNQVEYLKPGRKK